MKNYHNFKLMAVLSHNPLAPAPDLAEFLINSALRLKELIFINHSE